MYQSSNNSQSVDGSLPSKTPVSLLQELCMRRGISPKYDLLQIEGPVHEPTFVYRVTVGEFAANGSGQTKKKARHAAAKAVLDIIIQGGSGSQGQTTNNQELSSQIVSPYDDGIPGNPVGALQELCMSRRWPPPTYDLTAEEGFPHERTFSICCTIGSHKEIGFSISGAGKSKKLSKRQAAHKMIQKLKDQPVDQGAMNVLADDDDEVNLESAYPVPDGSCATLTKACTEGENQCTLSFSVKKEIKSSPPPLKSSPDIGGGSSNDALLNNLSPPLPPLPSSSTNSSLDILTCLHFKRTCPHLSPLSDRAYRSCQTCFNIILEHERKRIESNASNPNLQVGKSVNNLRKNEYLINTAGIVAIKKNDNDYEIDSEYELKLRSKFDAIFQQYKSEVEKTKKPGLEEKNVSARNNTTDSEFSPLSAEEKQSHVGQLNHMEATQIQLLKECKDESDFESLNGSSLLSTDKEVIGGLMKDYTFDFKGTLNPNGLSDSIVDRNLPFHMNGEPSQLCPDRTE